ncbi:hypothetical protein ARMGADRAFT_1034475 [Armillaria gallica]|uniref:Uncharacterized protein n=1 Tax=Armillaria gallica TaxID=47427 RepID=A0A2H3DFJ5_ARMGA|nr:hypothetical protein ARMGADRAFT_1034475 [Armillaria gallica]
MNRHVFPVLVGLHDDLTDDPLVSMYVASLNYMSIRLRVIDIAGLWNLLLVKGTGSVWECRFGSRRCRGCRAWTRRRRWGNEDGAASATVLRSSFHREWSVTAGPRSFPPNAGIYGDFLPPYYNSGFSLRTRSPVILARFESRPSVWARAGIDDNGMGWGIDGRLRDVLDSGEQRNTQRESSVTRRQESETWRTATMVDDVGRSVRRR